MSPSIFTLNHPIAAYDILYGIYVYALGIGLFFSWALLSWMDLIRRKPANALLWGFAVLVLPLLGGGYYLMVEAQSLSRKARVAMVLVGLIIWGVALAYGVPKIWGPLIGKQTF